MIRLRRNIAGKRKATNHGRPRTAFACYSLPEQGTSGALSWYRGDFAQRIESVLRQSWAPLHLTGDVGWTIVPGELKRRNKPATVNHHLALIRNLLHMAWDEWQSIDKRFVKLELAFDSGSVREICN
ncbi:hypothetical protein [Glaciimonas immobilis]|uniref:Uncharacterized protein n=1 Tax=Glaciimonas immobilis TaxID=728004 RepID=A0A840RZC5_9BURK|nr:hypothetical protein [Glaciimonas immobilis]KAF3996203.1 hypothetical protein HAV38_19720 [Glaciimonas immobilis]MBB5202582.1 hypothetical protein [Glaciimonas immobilis]